MVGIEKAIELPHYWAPGSPNFKEDYELYYCTLFPWEKTGFRGGAASASGSRKLLSSTVRDLSPKLPPAVIILPRNLKLSATSNWPSQIVSRHERLPVLKKHVAIREWKSYTAFEYPQAPIVSLDCRLFLANPRFCHEKRHRGTWRLTSSSLGLTRNDPLIIDHRWFRLIVCHPDPRLWTEIMLWPELAFVWV